MTPIVEMVRYHGGPPMSCAFGSDCVPIVPSEGILFLHLWLRKQTQYLSRRKWSHNSSALPVPRAFNLLDDCKHRHRTIGLIYNASRTSSPTTSAAAAIGGHGWLRSNHFPLEIESRFIRRRRSLSHPSINESGVVKAFLLAAETDYPRRSDLTFSTHFSVATT